VDNKLISAIMSCLKTGEDLDNALAKELVLSHIELGEVLQNVFNQKLVSETTLNSAVTVIDLFSDMINTDEGKFKELLPVFKVNLNNYITDLEKYTLGQIRETKTFH